MSQHWRARPVVAEDEPLLRRIYAGTRQAELALTGWDAPACERFLDLQYRAQALHYGTHNPGAVQDIVETAAGSAWQAAGRLWLHRRRHSLHVLDIALLPECCGRGLGTQVLRSVMDEAAAGGRAVTIYVEQGNPARRLYERLGFVPRGPVQGVHQHMAWRAVQQTTGQVCDEQA